LSRGDPAPITPVADGLALDRITPTRNLRVLEHRGLVAMVAADAADGRRRLALMTEAGARVLAQALVTWRAVRAEVERGVRRRAPARLFVELADLTD
jgi:DNA-binding MarR family transcriptional regulator